VRRWLLIGILVVVGLLEWRAVRAWRSEPALWGHAYVVAPRSPRAVSNYVKALIAAGRDAEADAILNRREP